LAALTTLGVAMAVGVVATASTAATRPAYVRAALPPGTINHIFVIDFENEGYEATFGPSSPATYLNKTLRPEGELIEHYYAIGHDSLDNYIAQISGQAPTKDTE
jgi:hypothetical protein